MTHFAFSWPVLAVFMGIVAWAVINDIRSFRIPNIACAALVLLYPAWLAVDWPATDPLRHIAEHVGVALAMLAVGFLLFLLRAFGAGDAKLLAAVALWAGPNEILSLVLVTAIAGGALSLVVIVYKVLSARFGPGLFYIYMHVSAFFAARLMPRQASEAKKISASKRAARGPANMSLARPIPYGVAIGAGAVIVAYGLLTTSGAA